MIVDSTDDPDYDAAHQAAVNAFFDSGTNDNDGEYDNFGESSADESPAALNARVDNA